MSSEIDLGNELRRVVAGEVEHLEILMPTPLPILREAARQSVPRLTVEGASVARVLRGMLSGAVTPQDAQRWASFMRRGYFAGLGGGPVVPIDIDYEASAEDTIADAISRLDEIGDLIDGEVSPDEIGRLLLSLDDGSGAHEAD